MRLLLDTHVALWAIESAEALSAEARAAILQAAEVRLSVVSPWELVIKAKLGKIVLHRSVEQICHELERALGAVSLPVTLPHVLEVGNLAPHHGDPFDRLLIAQARVEGLTLVTRDRLFEPYGVPIIHA